MRKIKVAIDGPAGAGKSTTSRLLAQRLGYSLLDTGAIYRTVALLGRSKNIAWDDGARLAELAIGLRFRFALEGEVNRVFVTPPDGPEEEVSREIRTPEISDGASRVSALPEVRAALLGIQRRLGAEGGIVAEGRDIGTVVFPDAEAKFFLVASSEERARRRVAELRAAGRTVDEAATAAEMRERDERDSSRAAAPLKKAADAVEVDSTRRSADEVVAAMAEVVAARAAVIGENPIKGRA